MGRNQSLKASAAIAGTAILVVVAVLVALSIWSVDRFEGSVGDLNQTAEASRHLSMGDMMHDALRGDVYRALHDSANAVAKREEIVGEATEHHRRFVEEIEALSRMPLPPALAAQAAALVEPVEAYGRLGEAVVSAAYEAPGRVAMMLDTFDARFGELEDLQESLGDAIKAHADAIDAATQSVMSRVHDATWAAGAVALVIILALQLLVRRRVVRPIAEAALVARAFAAGRYDTPVDTRAGAEIGDLMTALAGWRQDALARQGAERAERERVAREAARQTRVVALVDGFRREVESLLAAVGAGMGRLGETSGRLSTIADEAVDHTGRIAAGSEEASTNVASVAGATEELVTTVSGLAEQIREASESLTVIARSAETSNAQVAELAGRADRIGAVVGLIRDVAGQTNLLALNATIEAARAGESGRGFAVVAAEVKSLAGQTSRATSEIAEQVEGIQDSTRQAVASIREIAGRLRAVDEATGAIAAAISQQSDATAEIGRGIASAAAGAGAVAANVGSVRGSVEDTRVATRVVSDVSGDVTASTDRLRHAVQRFLTEVAA